MYGYRAAVIVVVFLGGFTYFPLHIVTVGQEVSAVINGWQKREDRIQSISCKWSTDVAFRPGVRLLDFTEIGDSLEGSDEDDMKLRTGVQVWSVLLDRTCMKVVSSGLKWDAIGGVFDDWTTTFAFDGNEDLLHEAFVSDSSPLLGTSVCVIDRSGHFSGRHDFFLLPLLVNCRPIDKALGHIDPVELEISNTKQRVLNGIKCWLLEQEDGAGKWTYWVDPLREYAVVRYMYSDLEGRILNECDIRIRQVTANPPVWMPEGWRATTYLRPSGVIREFVEATVESVEVNREYNESSFHFELPAGTNVHVKDGRNHVQYLVTEDGDQRVLMRWRDPELGDQSSGERVGRASSRTIILAIAGLVVVAAIVVVQLRRIREKERG